LPWWSFAVTNLLIAVAIQQKPWVSFLTGALGVGAIWAGLATGIDMANNHILSSKVAMILPLHGSYVLLIVITAIIGALVGGLASLTGSYMRKAS
jgi:cell division protein FtsX